MTICTGHLNVKAGMADINVTLGLIEQSCQGNADAINELHSGQEAKRFSEAMQSLAEMCNPRDMLIVVGVIMLG